MILSLSTDLSLFDFPAVCPCELTEELADSLLRFANSLNLGDGHKNKTLAIQRRFYELSMGA